MNQSKDFKHLYQKYKKKYFLLKLKQSGGQVVYYDTTQLKVNDPIIVASFELGEKKTFSVNDEILFVRNQINGEYSDVYAKHKNGDEKETILQNYEVVIKKTDLDGLPEFEGNKDLDINKFYLLIAKDTKQIWHNIICKFVKKNADDIYEFETMKREEWIPKCEKNLDGEYCNEEINKKIRINSSDISKIIEVERSRYKLVNPDDNKQTLEGPKGDKTIIFDKKNIEISTLMKRVDKLEAKIDRHIHTISTSTAIPLPIHHPTHTVEISQTPVKLVNKK